MAERRCSICYDALDDDSASGLAAVSTDELLTAVHEQWRQCAIADDDVVERRRGGGDVAGAMARRAAHVCQSEPERHPMCVQCAVSIVKHPTCDRCPTCKGALSHAVSMCQQLWSSEQRLAYARRRQANVRTFFHARLAQLRDEYARRLVQASNYYVAAVPHAQRFDVSATFDADARAVWRRRDDGQVFQTTIEGAVKAHEPIAAAELQRIVAHTSGLRLESLAANAHRRFAVDCDAMRDELTEWTHWPSEAEFNAFALTNEAPREHDGDDDLLLHTDGADALVPMPLAPPSPMRETPSPRLHTPSPLPPPPPPPPPPPLSAPSARHFRSISTSSRGGSGNSGGGGALSNSATASVLSALPRPRLAPLAPLPSALHTFHTPSASASSTTTTTTTRSYRPASQR